MAEAHTSTRAKIVLTKYIQCWASCCACNNHSNYRSIEKRPCKISCKGQCLLLYWNTFQHWRECLPPVECYKTVFRLNGLDFNGYFKDCKSENTRANRPHKMQMKSAKANSLKYSFFEKIIKDWNNLPNHLFNDEIGLSNFLSTQNGDIFQLLTNHRSADWVSHLAGLPGFFPQENCEIRKLWKAISSVLRGRFCLKCSLNRTNRLTFFAEFYLHVFTYNYSILINILCGFKVFWTSYSVRCSCISINHKD